MPTTFHVTNFKNKTLGLLTGAGNPSPSALAYVNVYNGVQPADPSAAPAGSPVFSSVTIGLGINPYLTAAGAGISSLTIPRSANASSTVSSLTFARIYDTGQQATIDTPVGLSEGGAILDALSTLVGNPITLKQLSLMLPSSNGTLLFSQSLVDRMVDLWTGIQISAGRPLLGIDSIIDLYSGSVPGSADTPATGTKLASFVGNAVNWFSTPAAGSCALASNPSTTAIGTGTASYFRWYKTVVNILLTVQGTAGAADTDIVLNTADLVSGVTSVSITEATLSI